MKTTKQNIPLTRTYVLIDQNDKSVYETTSFNEIHEIANTTQLLKIYKVFWVAERTDDYSVSVWHEYRQDGSHLAVVCDIACIRPNEENLKSLLNDINYYSNRKDIKKVLLEDLKQRREARGNRDHFDRKIKELKKIFKTRKEDKFYVCNLTGAVVKKVGKKFMGIASMGKPEAHINAVIVKHDCCEDDVGSTYEYRLAALTRVER